jgi:16S rRNA (adenine1518-N6/adenine1519-N6)-dimethyltransferase
VRRREPAAPPRDRPRLRKSLGQHHLRDPRSLAPLLEFLRLGGGDPVLEIGPGGGVLTEALLERGARVLAVEIDLAWLARLARRLRESGSRFPQPASRARLVAADALELDWSRLPAGWRVAGNLPYNVGTPIVERLLEGAPPGTRAGFLLQREVVERLVARPGDEAYGGLSVLVAARARAVALGRVRPGAFVPRPKVESAFVGLETVSPPLPPAEMPRFEALVRAAFAQRRKSLRNALGAAYGRGAAEARLAAAGIDAGRRAETLGLEELLRLHAAGEVGARS